MVNTHLILLFYRGQFQLATNDAFYSDGDRYRPAIVMARELKTALPNVQSVLVLGAGLGSIVYVLRKRRIKPRFTLVEKDKTVLQMALELFATITPQPEIEPVCADAQNYMAQNSAKYDLIFLDVFSGRVVPDFVTTPGFLSLCRNSIAEGGHLAFNYIINDEQEWQNVKQTFASVFPGYRELDLGINRVLVV
jgi:spermidine synthase